MKVQAIPNHPTWILGTELNPWEELEEILSAESSLQPQNNFNMIKGD